MIADSTKFQLEHLSNDDLELLIKTAKAVLGSRRRGGGNLGILKIRKQANRKVARPRDDEVGKARDILARINAEGLKCIPERIRSSPQDILRFLAPLIDQDWSFLYPRFNGEKRFYVYAHVDPRGAMFTAQERLGGNWGGAPFYIGKGCGNRAFDLKRNQGHGKRLKAIIDAGFDEKDIVKIVFSGLDEGHALEIEAKLIYFFGSIYGEVKKSKRAVLLNLDIPSIPVFEGTMFMKLDPTWQPMNPNKVANHA